MGIQDDLTQLADQLVTDHVVGSASTDPAALPRFPAAWLRLEQIQELTLGGDLELDVTVHLVAAGGPGHARQLDQLAVAYQDLRRSLNALGVTCGPARPVGLLLPGGGSPHPAWAVQAQIITTTEQETNQ